MDRKSATYPLHCNICSRDSYYLGKRRCLFCPDDSRRISTHNFSESSDNRTVRARLDELQNSTRFAKENLDPREDLYLQPIHEFLNPIRSNKFRSKTKEKLQTVEQELHTLRDFSTSTGSKDVLQKDAKIKNSVHVQNKKEIQSKSYAITSGSFDHKRSRYEISTTKPQANLGEIDAMEYEVSKMINPSNELSLINVVHPNTNESQNHNQVKEKESKVRVMERDGSFDLKGSSHEVGTRTKPQANVGEIDAMDYEASKIINPSNEISFINVVFPNTEESHTLNQVEEKESKIQVMDCDVITKSASESCAKTEPSLPSCSKQGAMNNDVRKRKITGKKSLRRVAFPSTNESQNHNQLKEKESKVRVSEVDGSFDLKGSRHEIGTRTKPQANLGDIDAVDCEASKMINPSNEISLINVVNPNTNESQNHNQVKEKESKVRVIEVDGSFDLKEFIHEVGTRTKPQANVGEIDAMDYEASKMISSSSGISLINVVFPNTEESHTLNQVEEKESKVQVMEGDVITKSASESCAKTEPSLPTCSEQGTMNNDMRKRKKITGKKSLTRVGFPNTNKSQNHNQLKESESKVRVMEGDVIPKNASESCAKTQPSLTTCSEHGAMYNDVRNRNPPTSGMLEKSLTIQYPNTEESHPDTINLQQLQPGNVSDTNLQAPSANLSIHPLNANLQSRISDIVSSKGEGTSSIEDICAILGPSGCQEKKNTPNLPGSFSETEPQSETLSGWVCDKAFNDHLFMQGGKKYYKCCFCNTGHDIGELQKHMITHYSIFAICTKCGEYITEKAAHGIEHSCLMCEKKFTCRTSLEQHISSDYSTYFANNCMNCKRTITQHMFDTKNKLYRCCKCDYTGTRKPFVHSHIHSHTNLKLFKCFFCCMSFSVQEELREHLDSHSKS